MDSIFNFLDKKRDEIYGKDSKQKWEKIMEKLARDVKGEDDASDKRI